MGAHALGAAAYAARAVELAEPRRPAAASEEICWQLSIISAEVRAALRQLPPVGEDKSGPLGPGLLASGRLGAIVHKSKPTWPLPAKPNPAITTSNMPLNATKSERVLLAAHSAYLQP